ncbi:MAG: FAD-dependent oxidoreductase [Planctomycetota bacterium]|nr:FAD-dependent oxidoreductase [Planctomycetota bacterium]
MKAIVVGSGSFGSWSALKLQLAGHQVTLVDAWGPGNSRSSSGGETRVIRTVYGEDEFYVEMAHRSMRQWDELQQQVGKSLMELTGSLWLCGEDDSYLTAALPGMESLGLRLEEYSIRQACEKWPQVNFTGLARAVLEPTSGFLRARQACQAVAEQLETVGGKRIQARVTQPDISQPVTGIQLHSGETLFADVIVFACGPWMGELFPGLLEETIQVSRQEVYYFGVPSGRKRFEKGHLPIWLELNQPIYYGLPSIDQRGFKLARDERGPLFDPTTDERICTPKLVQQAREYLAIRFPDMADAPLVESRVCQYSNTLDGHFIIDRHQPSGLVMVGGGSGHGFKMGPAVGEAVLDIVKNENTISSFGLERFAGIDRKSTQFDHS